MRTPYPASFLLAALVLTAATVACGGVATDDQPGHDAAVDTPPGNANVVDAPSPAVRVENIHVALNPPCSSTCLAGECPGVVNVRSCTTSACDGSGSPVDDYQLLANAAAYVNNHNTGSTTSLGGPVTSTTMVYPGIFTVTEHVSNVFNAAAAPACTPGLPAAPGQPECCPTEHTNNPITFGNPNAGPSDPAGLVHDFSLIGCVDPNTGAAPVININGNFARHADIQSDPGSPEWISCDDAVTPFMIYNATVFYISNFEVNGNNQQTTLPDDVGCQTGTCSKAVAEGNSYGIYTQGCSAYELTNLHVHNIGTDGLYLGNALNSSSWDSNVTAQNVESDHNGRDGLSIAQLKDSQFDYCYLHDNGKPCVVVNGVNTACGSAAYAGYAGVDIEPNNVGVDIVDSVQFNNSWFYNNRGPDFSTGLPAEVQNLTFNSCGFMKEVDGNPLYGSVASPLGVFGITKGQINDSDFYDYTGGEIVLGLAYPPACNPAGQASFASSVTLQNSYVYASKSLGPAIVLGSGGGAPDLCNCGIAGDPNSCNAQNPTWPTCSCANTNVYPFVDVEATSFDGEFAWPVPVQPSPPQPQIGDSVGVFIELLGSTKFVGNSVVISQLDYPTAAQAYPNGGNALVILASSIPGVPVYSATNAFSTTPSPWPLGNDYFSVSYGNSRVCGDSFNGTGIRPGTGFPASDAQAVTSNMDPFVSHCGCPTDASTNQVFVPAGAPGKGSMVGCGGSVTWDKRACAAGFHVCSSAEWNTYRGVEAPEDNYWTADNLEYSGSGPNECEALVSGGYSCPTNEPMRVCTPVQPDSFGNQCNWTGCGLAELQNEFFGGCYGNTTAGTLCCANF